MIWFHIRNSPIRWALPALVVLDLAVLFLRSRYWVGVWPETGAAAQMSAYFVGAVGAGAAAWASRAPARHGVHEQLAVARVPLAKVEAYRLGATIVILVAPYLLGHVVAFAITAWTFPPGLHLWWGYFLQGLVAMLVAAGWGWIIGKLLGSVFGALAAVVGWLVLLLMMADYAGVTLVALRGPPELMVDLGSTAARLAMAVLLLGTLPWLSTTLRSGKYARAVAPAVTAALGLGIVLSATPAIVERAPAGQDVICADGPIRFCVWPAHEKYVPLLRDVNARVDAMPETFALPPRMNEVGIEKTRYVDSQGVIRPTDGDHAPDFEIIEGSPWSYAGAIG